MRFLAFALAAGLLAASTPALAHPPHWAPAHGFRHKNKHHKVKKQVRGRVIDVVYVGGQTVLILSATDGRIYHVVSARPVNPVILTNRPIVTVSGTFTDVSGRATINMSTILF